jgi:6-phosphogluconate dehydrogenase
MSQFDFGLVGLGVMGRNFILNVADHGYSCMGLDTDIAKVTSLVAEAGEGNVKGTTEVKNFTASLKTPRKIMLLVPAGSPVDAVIKDLLPHLNKGDLIIDGGNSHFEDTNRREAALKKEGIHFFGAGVSGGAEGARLGPSIMPGGDKKAYEIIRPIFEAVAAKVKEEPCVAYMGSSSAGNYVKMVHNGIEYGLMQLISEMYDLMKHMGISNRALSYTFSEWNEGRLRSFLVEITGKIFGKKEDAKHDLVDFILDKAKQKGTGKWTSQNAMDLGVAIPTIDSAVSMRAISSRKEQRLEAEKKYGKNKGEPNSDVALEDLEKALYFSFIITYAQGLTQLREASEEYRYNLDLEAISRIWRGGCIIRADLLEVFRKVFETEPGIPSILLDDEIVKIVKELVPSMQRVLEFALQNKIPTLSLSATLNYFFAFQTGRLPLNLIQAQRDYFGSHTYERTDKPGVFHTDWS